jgi:hypothetical protein
MKVVWCNQDVSVKEPALEEGKQASEHLSSTNKTTLSVSIDLNPAASHLECLQTASAKLYGSFLMAV